MSTQSLQFYDEFEFIPFIKTIMAAAGPAYATASENAKRNNAATCRIITSTPGDLDSQSGQDANEIKENTCTWTERFYDMSIEEVQDYIHQNSGNNIVYIEYSYKQLGKDETWFNRVCRLLNNDPMKIQRELLLKRMRGSSLSPYAPEDLQAIEERQGTIKEEIFINKIFKLDIYESINKKQCYFIGVDVANGYGEDNSAVTVWDPFTLKTVAEFRSANIGVKDLIKFIYLLVKKHIPRGILAIERNANGEAVLDHLRDTDIRMNIYYDSNKDLISDIDDKLDAHGMIKREAARRKLYGIYTQGKSREQMFSLLEGHINDHKDKFIGRYLINDIMSLVRTKTGKIEAAKGYHDDSVMSYLMCLYLYYYGNNLERFGFVRGRLPDEKDRNKGMDYGNLYDYLSENDKKYFEGVYQPQQQNFNEIDMEAIINKNRGLVSEQELRMEENKDKPKVEQTKYIDPYTQKIMQEMQQAQLESEAFNRRHNFTNSYENTEYDEYFEDGLDLGIFNELNDF